MTFCTEDQLLSATKIDDTDKRMQRAIKLRREIRVLGRAALGRKSKDELSALEVLYFTIGCAVLGLHAMKKYDFIAFQLECQPDRPRKQADMFLGFPKLMSQPDVEEIDELLDETDEGLASWRK